MMKLNREKTITIIQLFILLLFLSLTLLNEEFDLPHHLLGDPPVSAHHRHGEMIIELTVFLFVATTFFLINRNLLKKIKKYQAQKVMLERTFYHDIRNTALLVNGFARLLLKPGKKDSDKYKKVLYRTSMQLLEEIDTQRDISYAEKNELPVHLQEINSINLLEELVEQYQNDSLARQRKVVCNPDSHDVNLVSDKIIIKRVLGNMIKNALEAADENETISLSCFSTGDVIHFEVHNPNFIPKDIQRRIFQFSFSTKGKGRGMGTYSMKLLSEKYLNGKISFYSSEKEGTTFKATYPLQS